MLCSYRNIVDMFFLLGLKVGQKVLRQPKCEFVEKSRANFTLSCTFSSYICQRNELENGGKKSYSRSHKAHRGWNSKNQHSNFGAKNSNRFENIFFLGNVKIKNVWDIFWDFQTLCTWEWEFFRLKITVIFYAEYLSFSVLVKKGASKRRVDPLNGWYTSGGFSSLYHSWRIGL